MELSPTVKQTVFACGALFNMMTLGVVLGYPALLNPALMDPSSDLFMDKYKASWLASLSGVSGLILVFALGPLMHIYGRRTANLCVTIPVLIGWILTSISNSVPLLFISRFLHSVGCGGVYFFATCIGEFSSPKTRCVLLNMKLFSVSLGIILVHSVGYFLHWKYLALAGVIPSAIALVITVFWPDTPDWLASKGRFQEAENVFFSLRGRTEDSENEIRKLIETETRKQKLTDEKIKFNLTGLRSKALWRPVALLTCGIILPEFGGSHFFPTYSVELASQIIGNKSVGLLYTIIIDTVSIISTVGSFCFVKKLKRRPLILYSGYSAILVLIVTSALLYARKNYPNNCTLTWITLSLLCLYFVIANSTVYAVSYMLMGELLPLEFRAIGSVINGMMFSFSFSVIVKLIPILQDYLDVHGMLIVCAGFMFLTLLYLHYDLPETKGRTLQDIGDYFRGKSLKEFNEDKMNSPESETILSK